MFMLFVKDLFLDHLMVFMNKKNFLHSCEAQALKFAFFFETRIRKSSQVAINDMLELRQIMTTVVYESGSSNELTIFY